jgi:hypothetical protein
MKADLTRATFDESKHYRSVRMQQGRVQLDSDWNEQQDITLHRVETETIDVVGPVAAPADDPGFVLTPTAPGTSLAISPGRAYVQGILCENDDAQATLDNQPDLPAGACVIVNDALQGLPPPDGTYIGLIHAWQRHITVLEDPSIREIALGGPDTTTRLKTVWQVQVVRVGNLGAAINCLTNPPAWTALTQPSTGTLAARAKPTPDPGTPCKLAPTAGYMRLDNLLYRVEIHIANAADPAYKWSHDNGYIAALWLAAAPGAAANQVDLTVSSLGRDSTVSIDAGHWVELFDDTTELEGLPGTLVQVVKAEGNTVTVDTTTVYPAGASTALANFPANPRVRRWDGWNSIAAATAASADAPWIELEDGVEINFNPPPGVYRHGDYWMFPARTATAISEATVEWPTSAGNPVFETPQGPLHVFGELAVLSCAGGVFTVLYQCLPTFPALSEIENLYYVGGDAQSVLPLEPLTLPRPLEASVAKGSLPVPGAVVRFTITGGNGSLSGLGPQVDVTTPADGIASCTWTLDPDTAHQYVSAVIVENGVPVANKYQPVHYSACLLQQEGCACTVCVTPAAQLAQPSTLQNAIVAVINAGGGTVCLEAGSYTVPATLVIDNARSLVIRGQGGATNMVFTGATVIQVFNSGTVALEDLTISVGGAAGAGAQLIAVLAQSAQTFRAEGLTLQPPPGDATAIGLCVLGEMREFTVKNCTFETANGISNMGPVEGVLLPRAVRIDQNAFNCGQNGISLNVAKSPESISISGNTFATCASTALTLIGQLTGRELVEITDNRFSITGFGVDTNWPSVAIERNELTCSVAAANTALALSNTTGGEGCVRIRDNRIRGFGTSIAIQSGIPGLNTEITDNDISVSGAGILFIGGGTAQAQSVVVAGNEVRDIDQAEGGGETMVAAINVQQANHATVRDNTILRCGQSQQAGIIVGIALQSCDFVHVTGNDICGIGAAHGSASLAAFGITAFAPLLHARISENRVFRDPGTAPAADSAFWTGIYVSNIYGSGAQRHALSWFGKRLPPSRVLKLSTATAASVDASVRTIVSHNQVAARGIGYGIAVVNVLSCTVSHNQSDRITPAKVLFPNVLVASGTAVVDGNQVSDSTLNAGLPVVHITTPAAAVTVLGNISSNQIFVGAAALGPPWAPLNVPP